MDAAVASALAAFEGGPWPALVRSERARLLLRIADAIDADSERLYRLEALNNGRPITETRAQLSRVPEWFRYNAGLLASQRQAVLPSDGPYLTYQQRLPLGVCGIITPFNHPLLILARSLSAALANGNTVVVKPSELTPLTTLALLDIMAGAGLPDGVVNVVTGGRDAGIRLTQHPDVAKITLTGGTEAGRAAALATAARFARVTAELGGKTPVIVFDDVDPLAAAEGAAFAAFVAAGQSCVAGSRFLVQRANYDAFVTALAARAAAIRVGDPTLPDTQMGPLISARQRDKVRALIDTGIAEGARLAAGGGQPDLPEPLRAGFFLRADRARRRTNGDDGGAGGDLRPGGGRHPLRRRGRRRTDGQRQPLRPRRRGVDHRHQSSAPRRVGHRGGHGVDQRSPPPRTVAAVGRGEGIRRRQGRGFGVLRRLLLDQDHRHPDLRPSLSTGTAARNKAA